MPALMLLGLAAGAAPVAPAAPPADPALSAILFFDDSRLNSRSGLRRVVGTPTLLSAYRDPGVPNHHLDDDPVDLTYSGPSAFRVPGTTGFRMLYQNYPPGCCLLARSDDGIHWTRENTTASLPNMHGRKFPNQAFVAPSGFSFSSVFVDEHSDEQHRFKALVSGYDEERGKRAADVWSSGDGLRWTLMEGSSWMQPPLHIPEPPNFAYRNHLAGRVNFAARPGLGDRRVTFHETTNWTLSPSDTTPPELVFEPDALDTHDGLAEHYGMLVVPTDDIFVGLLYIFHTADCNAYSSESPHHVRSAASVSPVHRLTKRLSRSSTAGRWTCSWRRAGTAAIGCVACARQSSRTKGRLRASTTPARSSAKRTGPGSCTRRHQHTSTGTSLAARRWRFMRRSILRSLPTPCAKMGALRSMPSLVDTNLAVRRWVAYESAAGVGRLGTKALFVRGGVLELNVDARYGSIRAAVLATNGTALPGFGFEDCIANGVHVDDTGWAPTWKGGTVGGFNGTAIRLEVELSAPPHAPPTPQTPSC